MKRFSPIIAAALLLTAASTAGAQTVYNTGQSGNVNGSFQDSKWQVSTNGGSTWFQAFQVQGPPSPPWQAATAAYSWISATTSASGGGPNYLFRQFIDLTGYDPTTASMSFNCAYDNNFFGYALNGGAASGGCNLWGFGGTQTISSGWIAGMNELRFSVNGDNTTDGLVVGNATISAQAVVATPEPASMVLMATGLLLVGGVARRRITRG